MKKSILSLLLMLCFIAVSVLTGCSALKSKQEKQDKPTAQEQQVQQEKEKNQEQVDREPVQTDGEDSSKEETPAQQGKKVTLTLYFASSDNSAIPSEKREVAVKDGAIMRAALEALLEGPKTKGLKKAIPDGTKILGLKKDGNTAVVDFSKEFATVGDIAEIVEIGSVVNTLTSINGVGKVKILVNGKDLIAPSGKPYGELSRYTVDANGFPVQGEKKTLILYFGNSDASALVAEKREVTVNKGDSLEKAIFEELKKGPKQKGLYPVIPTGSTLLSASTKDGICTLNLSQQFVDNNKGGSAGESMTVYSIVNSLTELSNVKKVQFLVNSKKRDVYLHLIFNEPFVRNQNIIKK